MMKEENEKKEIEILTEKITFLKDHIQDLFSFIPIGIILVDPKGLVLEVNPAMELITSMSVHNLVGVSIGKIFSDEMFSVSVKKGFVSGVRTFINGANGKKVPVSFFSKERKNRDGKTTGYFFAVINMTEVERMNEEARETKEILEVRIAARTRELQELATSLESQVGERTEELQERLEELEKMNRLMVGRELKMIEMKEKLESVEKELNEIKGGRQRY